MQEQARQRAEEAAWSIGALAERWEVDGQTAVMKREFESGIRAGILLVMDFPRAQLDFLEGHVGELREMLKDDNNQELH